MTDSPISVRPVETATSGKDYLRLRLILSYRLETAKFHLRRHFTPETFPKTEAALLDAVNADEDFQNLMSFLGIEHWALVLYLVDSRCKKMLNDPEYPSTFPDELPVKVVIAFNVCYTLVKIGPPPSLMSRIYSAVVPGRQQPTGAMMQYIKELTADPNYKPLDLVIYIKDATTGISTKFAAGVKVDAASWPTYYEFLEIITLEEGFSAFLKRIGGVRGVEIERVIVDKEVVSGDESLEIVANSLMKKDKVVVNVRVLIEVDKIDDVRMEFGVWSRVWAFLNFVLLVLGFKIHGLRG